MFQRLIPLPPSPEESLFLWGPRQVGKSTLLRALYPEALWVDLLRAEQFRRYAQRPQRLREELDAFEGPGHAPPLVVIDEVQKVPALLDEVHLLIEERGTRFVLCGSSARKVRRGHTNLLGGRALRYELLGLVSAELGDAFDLDRMLNHGWLPRHYLAPRPRRRLDAYVSDYLQQEIAAEGVTRNLPAFASFLQAAALSDTKPVRFSTIARDCGVSAPTAKAYYQILVDTLLGRWLPPWRRRPKRRTVATSKFYFADVGVVNFLARRGHLEAPSPLYGKAFESWIHHELSGWLAYVGSDLDTPMDLSYWRLTSGPEVDFILGDMRLAIEAKATHRVTPRHLRGLRVLREEHPEVQDRWIVCLEDTPRRTEDGILVLPARAFVDRLWRAPFPP